MKRLTLFCAALFAAVTSFASITYELNGGTVSSYLTAQDMYADLNADYNAATGATATWTPLADLTQGSDGATGLPTQVAAWDLTFFNNTAKWTWLQTYLDDKCAEQGKTIPSGNSSFMRYNLSSFFVNGVRPGWPASADYTTCGVAALDAYQSYWKSSFANPTDPTGEVTLYAPYKEGYTFDGWYATADFSGAAVQTVDATTTGTLYAKWIEYIPTIAEVKALEDSVNTKTKGVVNFISGKQVFIQDATGGILLYMSATPTFVAGDEVLVSGMKVIYHGAPEIASAVCEKATPSTLPNAQNLTIAEIKDNLLKYFAQRVMVEGVKVAKHDSNGTYVRYNNDTIQLYKVVLDETTFPVGKKLNFTGVVANYWEKAQLMGNVADAIALAAAPVDGCTYEQKNVEDVNYDFTSNWMFSNTLGNFTSNKPNLVAEGTRGMTIKNGIMYFPYRESNDPVNAPYLVCVNAATGDMLDPVVLQCEEGGLLCGGSHLFGVLTNLKCDNAGNMLSMNLPTTGGDFRIWVIDETTGAVRTLVDMTGAPDTLADETVVAHRLKDIFPDAATIRLDRLGVLGDINGSAVIMSANQNSADAFAWFIEDGVWDGECHLIPCAAGEGVTFGAAPEVQPIEGDMFYVDGFNTTPLLFDFDGVLVDAFVDEAAPIAPIATGHNGIFEFEMAGEYFLLTAYNNTVAKEGENGASSTFCLYRCKDENRIFAEMTPLWVFPANGMGATSNPQRVATPFALVNGTNSADVWVFTAENGYGKYTFTSDKQVAGGIENLWIIGECATAKWLPGASKQCTKVADGVFEVEETLTGTWFAFVYSIDNCTATTTDWDVINAHRLGSNPSGAEVAIDGTANPITGKDGDYSFTVPAAGTYKFVIDVNAMTVTVTPVSAVDNVDALSVEKVIEDGQVYIIKNGVKYTTVGAVVE